MVQIIAKKGDFFLYSIFTILTYRNYRMVLNLKKPNKYIENKHSKIKSLQNVFHMVKPVSWMASVDLKDAYCSVTIHQEYQKYLQFLWECPNKFIAMSNGYGPTVGSFTKLMKLPFSFVPSEGYQLLLLVSICQFSVFVSHICRRLLSTRFLAHDFGLYKQQKFWRAQYSTLR